MKSSVQQFARELNRLCRNNIPMSQAFDMLENTAKSNMDLIVINVMRDSFNEVLLEAVSYTHLTLPTNREV